MRRDELPAEIWAISMVQLRPLPGSWRYQGELLGAIVEAALAETAALADAGSTACNCKTWQQSVAAWPRNTPT